MGFKLVEVEWEDSIRHMLDQVKKDYLYTELHPACLTTCGYLIEQTKEKLLIARDVYEEEGEVHFRDPIVIPAKNVFTIRTLRTHKWTQTIK